jgi:hypothetical protein
MSPSFAAVWAARRPAAVPKRLIDSDHDRRERRPDPLEYVVLITLMGELVVLLPAAKFIWELAWY